jgi:hypothetical protein
MSGGARVRRQVLRQTSGTLRQDGGGARGFCASDEVKIAAVQELKRHGVMKLFLARKFQRQLKHLSRLRARHVA